MGVPTGNDGSGLVALRLAADLNIELLRNPLFQANLNPLFFDEKASFSHRLGSAIAQHLQLVGRLTNQGAQGDGDGQTNHTRARNPHPHGVLQDVRTEAHVNLLRTATKGLGSLRHTEGHGNGFGTTNGWNHLALDEADNLSSFFCLYHSV